MNRTSNRLIAFTFAIFATLTMQGTMLAGFDNLAQAGQTQAQANALAAACTAANAKQLQTDNTHLS